MIKVVYVVCAVRSSNRTAQNYKTKMYHVYYSLPKMSLTKFYMNLTGFLQFLNSFFYYKCQKPAFSSVAVKRIRAVEVEDTGAKKILETGLDTGDLGLEQIVLRLLVVGLSGTP